MTTEWTNVRGIDKDLYRQAKASAAILGKTMGQWLNEAIKGELAKEEKKKND